MSACACPSLRRTPGHVCRRLPKVKGGSVAEVPGVLLRASSRVGADGKGKEDGQEVGVDAGDSRRRDGRLRSHCLRRG